VEGWKNYTTGKENASVPCRLQLQRK
jgi:hypothetical protein